ncbi:hypothetical protein KC901_01525 [Patescibacteria group bacterium]|nr:hypothetical protein [Patescibacteria group bacterium]
MKELIKLFREYNIIYSISERKEKGTIVQKILITAPHPEPTSHIELFENGEYFTYVFSIMSELEHYRLEACTLFHHHYLLDIEDTEHIDALPANLYQLNDPFCDYDIIFDDNEIESVIINEPNGDIIIMEHALITPENIISVQLMIENEHEHNSLTQSLVQYFQYTRDDGIMWLEIPLNMFQTVVFET